MDPTTIESALQAWDLPEDKKAVITAVWRAGKDASGPFYMLANSVFVTTSQDLLFRVFERTIAQNCTMLAQIGTKMRLFTVATAEMHHFNINSMPSSLAARLVSPAYVPSLPEGGSCSNQPHPLTIDDFSSFHIKDGKVCVLDLSNSNLVSLNFEFAPLGVLFPDVEVLDVSYNPKLTLRGVSQFLSAHMFPRLRSVKVLGIDHSLRSNGDALSELRGCLNAVAATSSILEEVLVFDHASANRYSILLFHDFTQAVQHYAQVGADLEDTSFSVDTIVFATPDVPGFELLCLETPKFLPQLKSLYIDLPKDYDFTRLFNINPQIQAINGIPVFGHIVSRATIETQSNPFKDFLVQLVIEKFYEAGRPVPVDYKGDPYTDGGKYNFDQSKEYFIFALFPTPEVDIRLHFKDAAAFLAHDTDSVALISLSLNKDISFILVAKDKLSPSPKYAVTLLHTCTVDRSDNDYVLLLKAGFPVIKPPIGPSTTIQKSLREDAETLGWGMYPALRVALLSSVLVRLWYAPYAFESTCTGIALCAYYINNIRSRVEDSIFVGYCPDANWVVHGVPAILSYLLMRSVRNTVLLVLQRSMQTSDEVALYRCIVTLHVDDEVVTGFTIKELKKGVMDYTGTTFTFSDRVITVLSGPGADINFLDAVSHSLDLVDLRGFANRQATLNLSAYILPTINSDGAQSFYCTFLDTL